MTPGPAPLHPDAVTAGVEPLVHHRSPVFRRRFIRVQEGLQGAFRTAGPVAVLAASGTGAMEAAMVNLFASGDRVVVLETGKFGRRWTEIAEAYGIRAIGIEVEPGQPFGPEDAAEAVAAHRPVAGITVTASETSTGAAYDVHGIARAVRRVEEEAVVVVDAITGVGALPMETDSWDLDAVCGGSQKAFMMPPGLGFVACSPRGWERIAEKRSKPRYYFDLRKYEERAPEQTPFTPATGLVLQLEAALGAIHEAGGIGALEDNARRLSAATRAALEALRLQLLAPDSPSPAVTAARAPRSGQAPEIVAGLRDGHGVQIAGGQGPLKPDVFRIGHLGYIDAQDLLGTLAALEAVLSDLDHPHEPGAGIIAARAVLESMPGADR